VGKQELLLNNEPITSDENQSCLFLTLSSRKYQWL